MMFKPNLIPYNQFILKQFVLIIGFGFLLFPLNPFSAWGQGDAEPNDTPEMASPISVNVEINGQISSAGANDYLDNLDWFLVEIPSDGHVIVHTSYSPEGYDFQFQLYGKEDLVFPILGTETNLPTPESRETWLQAGTYFFNINGRGQRITRNYQFTLEHRPAMPVDTDLEPNDTSGTASETSINTVHTGHISYVGKNTYPDNLDWYRVEIPSDGHLTVHTSYEPEGIDFQFQLYGKEDLVFPILGTETNLPTPATRETWLQAGTYFFNINGRGQRIGRTYQFRLEHQPARSVDIDSNSNDESSAAAAAILNASHTGHISFVGMNNQPDDTDWYSFDLPQADRLTVQLSHDQPGFDFQYLIYNEQLSIVGGTETNLPAVTNRSVDLDAGHYFFQVNGRRQRVGRVYEFSLQAPKSMQPPSQPAGHITLSYTITKPSNDPQGNAVAYIFRWTSDNGDDVTHGPTTALQDVLTEWELIQTGETWTVTVIPNNGVQDGPPATAQVKIVDAETGVIQWLMH